MHARHNPARWSVALLTLGLGALCTPMPVPAAAAQDSDRQVTVHGYGTFGFGDTDANAYQFGDEDGSYKTSQLAVAFAATFKSLRVAGQVEWDTSEAFEGTRSEVDYAFAEWKFRDELRVRFGKARHPFGIYAEILDVGTLRPFLSLPIGVYGPTGAVAEHYTGAGVTGLATVGSWEVAYDIYGGEVVLAAAHPWEALEAIGFEEDERLRVSDLVGGRLIAAAPLSGLSFGFSIYSGQAAPEREFGEEGEGKAEGGEEGEGEEGEAADTNTTYGLQLELQRDRWLVRSEVVHHDFANRHQIDGFYVELAHRFNERWQLAGRYDWGDVELVKEKIRREVVEKAPSLLDHRDIGVSLNYYFDTNVVVKLGYHVVDGNFFARPLGDELREAVEEGALETETELVQIGVSFNF